MPEELIRLLRPDGKLEAGQEAPEISAKDLLRLYRVMLLNRRIDERMLKLQRQGRIGFYVGSTGEEAAIIGSAFALEPTDWLLPCYRELGAILLRGYPLYDLCCQLFGNAEDKILGRQMPNHYASADLHYGSITSTVASQIPHAVGIGMASRIQGTGEVALTYFGDGATSTGEFHVAANFASVYKSATIFFCRNNQWAISVPVTSQTVSKSIAIKASAYGMPGVQVDGNDILAVYTVTRAAAERARRGDGPTLIEAVTYRLGAHSSSDDPRVYRDDTEVEKWAELDPIPRLRAYLGQNGFIEEGADQALEEEIAAEIEEALVKAEQIGPPPVDTMFDDVLDEVPWHLEEQRNELHEALNQDAGHRGHPLEH